MTDIYKTKTSIPEVLDTMFLYIWLLTDKVMVPSDLPILLSSYLKVATVKTALKNHRNYPDLLSITLWTFSIFISCWKCIEF